MDPEKPHNPDLGDRLGKFKTDDFAGLALEFRLTPGKQDAEDLSALLCALSDMHTAAGGTGLHFYQSPSGLFRGIPVDDCYRFVFDAESLSEHLKDGGYLNPTHAVNHALAVLHALLSHDNGPLYFRKKEEFQLFEPLKVDTTIRALLSEDLQIQEDLEQSAELKEVFFAHSKALDSLIALGEFASVEQCLNVALSTVATMLDYRKEGWDLIKRSGNAVELILLPHP